MRRSRAISVMLGFGLVLGIAGVAAAVWAPKPIAPEAEKALAAVSEPSIPLPLPGASRVGASTYVVPGSCAKARETYRGPDAPVPDGARLSEEDGVLIVETTYGSSALFFAEGAGGCSVRIAASPTLVLTGAGPVPDAEGFPQVGCFGAGVEISMAAQLNVEGVPYVVFVGSETRSGTAGTVVRGTTEALLRGGRPKVSLWPTTIEEAPDGTFVATLKSEDGPVTLAFTCTTNLFAVIGQGPG